MSLTIAHFELISITGLGSFIGSIGCCGTGISACGLNIVRLRFLKNLIGFEE